MNTVSRTSGSPPPVPPRLALIDPHWVDFMLGHISASWRVARTLGIITAVRQETRDMKTFSLRPNWRFRGFTPGQYVGVKVVIEGVVNERFYSLTSLPSERELSFTVKRTPGGKVSNWLHDHLAVGDAIELGEPQGDYVLPLRPAPLLLVAGGSGITPNYALVRAALHMAHDADVTLLYYARHPSDFAFQAELRELMGSHPNFRVSFLAESKDGRFRPAQLSALAPDFSTRQAYVCGPAGLMDAVARTWERAGIAERLRKEVFGPGDPVQGTKAVATAQVTFRWSQRTVVNSQPTLLETAEAAGLRPASGCRMGICKTCVCSKVSGVIRDKVTGEVDAHPNSRIKLCVSEPLGPVVLEL